MYRWNFNNGATIVVQLYYPWKGGKGLGSCWTEGERPQGTDRVAAKDMLPPTTALLGDHGPVQETTPPTPDNGLVEEGALRTTQPNNTEAPITYRHALRHGSFSNREQQMEHLEREMMDMTWTAKPLPKMGQHPHAGSTVSAELVIANAPSTNGGENSGRPVHAIEERVGSVRSTRERVGSNRSTGEKFHQVDLNHGDDKQAQGEPSEDSGSTVPRKLSYTHDELEQAEAHCKLTPLKGAFSRSASHISSQHGTGSFAQLQKNLSGTGSVRQLQKAFSLTGSMRQLQKAFSLTGSVKQLQKPPPLSIAGSNAFEAAEDEPPLYPFKGAVLHKLPQEDIVEEGIPPDIRFGDGMKHFELEIRHVIASNVPPGKNGGHCGCCQGVSHVLEVCFDTQRLRSEPIQLLEHRCKWEDNICLFIHQDQANFAKEEDDTSQVAGVVTVSVFCVTGLMKKHTLLGSAVFALRELLAAEVESSVLSALKTPSGRLINDGAGAPTEVSMRMVMRELVSQVSGKGPPTLEDSLAECEDGEDRERIRAGNSSRLSGVWAEPEMASMRRRRGGDTEIMGGGPATQEEGRGKLKDALVEYEGRELEDKEDLDYWREKLATVMESPWVHAAVMLVVFVDVMQIIIYTAVFNTTEDESAIQIGLNVGVVVLFFAELTLRQIAWQLRFWKDKWNVFDAIVIWASVLIMVGRYSYRAAETVQDAVDSEHKQETARVLRIVSRVAVGLRMLRLVLDLRKAKRLTELLQTRLRKTISQNKRRFTKHGFDIDLTYITNRVMAMSAPALGGHTAYRNDIHVVSRFLSLRHYGHFFVINLCDTYTSSDGSMGNYHPQMLFNQVLRVPVEDHCPPLFGEFVYACEAAARWMKLDNRNVVAIHCKGGKGRTGLVIGGLLMWTGHRRCAADALELFTFRRTFDYRPELGSVDTTEGEDPFAEGSSRKAGKGGHNQGVEGPSQKRYMFYLEAALYCSIDFWTCKKRFLSTIQLNNCSGPKIKPWYMSFVVFCQRIQVLDSLKTDSVTLVEGDLNLSCDVEVWGDVRVDFYAHSSEKNLEKRKLQFFVFFHVAFHAQDERVVFAKKNVDLLHKDKRHHKVGPEFRMEFVFGVASVDGIMGETERMKALFRKYGRVVHYKKGDEVVPAEGKEETIILLVEGSVEGLVKQVDNGEEGTNLGGQSYHPLGNCIPYPMGEGGADVRVPAVSLLGSDSVLGIGQFLASQGLGSGRTMPLRAREDLKTLQMQPPDELEGTKAGSHGVYRTSDYFVKRRARGMEGREQRWWPQGDGVEEVKEEGVLGLTVPELATLYRGMAIWMATYLERISVEQARMTALKALNDRQSVLMDHDQREKLHRSIVETFKLPVNEPLVFTCKCKGRVHGEENADRWIRVCITGSHVILDNAYFGPIVSKESRLIRADQLISAKFPDPFQTSIVTLHFDTPCGVPEDEEITIRPSSSESIKTPPASTRNISAGFGSLTRGISSMSTKRRKEDEQEQMELVFNNPVRARQCLEELLLLMKNVTEDSEHSKEHMTGTREMNELVKSCSKEYTLRKGEKIHNAHKTDALFLIQRGCIRLTRNGLVENVVREGSSFGLTNFVKGRVSVSYEAEASEDSRVWELLPTAVEEAVKDDFARKAEFALHICMLLDGQIKDTLRLGYPGEWSESENDRGQSQPLPSVRAPQSRIMQSLLTKRSALTSRRFSESAKF